EGADERQVSGRLYPRNGCFELFQCEERFEDEQVDASLRQCGRLLGERFRYLFRFERAVGFDHVTGRSHRTADQDGPTRITGCLSSQSGSRAIDLLDTV